jgi:Asp-tRNA(Asn)/Glu-tRNA(Gln) amidotransferase A subunit family amidase
MTMSIVALSAREMVQRMQSGAISAAETIAAHLRTIEAREPSICAWAHLSKDGAMEAAARADAARRSGLSLGPLHGLPIAVKDIIDTADMPTEFGSRLHEGRRPAADATIVARLRAAGAIIMGKVVTTEYALFAPGPTRNPHDLSKTPGGSSSGSAAAVAAQMAPVALATQTKGSIIRPASFCGVIGYKPSLGLLPRTGILRHSTLLDQPGVMARDVADAAFVVDAISGRDDADELSLEEVPSLLSRIEAGRPPPRLALVRGPYWTRASKRTREEIESFAANLWTPVAAIELPAEFETAEPTLDVLMCAGVAQSLTPDFERGRDAMQESVIRIIERGRALTAVDVLDAMVRRDRLRQLFNEIVAPYDALLTPAAVGAAPPAEEGTGDPIFAATWTLVGAPAVSLPLLTGEAGLPLGLQAVGPLRRDGALLHAASWLMRAASQPKAEAAAAASLLRPRR